MRFLCPGHRDNLNRLSEADLMPIWFEWMNQAALHYELQGELQDELQDRREAIAFSGCSIELSLIYLSKAEGIAQINACKKLCLSVMYCINSLTHNNDLYKANYILTIACDALTRHKETLEQDGEMQTSMAANINACIDTCLNVLHNESQHEHYFKAHLNLPFYHTMAIKNRMVH